MLKQTMLATVCVLVLAGAAHAAVKTRVRVGGPVRGERENSVTFECTVEYKAGKTWRPLQGAQVTWTVRGIGLQDDNLEVGRSHTNSQGKASYTWPVPAQEKFLYPDNNRGMYLAHFKKKGIYDESQRHGTLILSK